MAASSAADDEFILQVPTGLLVEKNGFSLDIGATIFSFHKVSLGKNGLDLGYYCQHCMTNDM